MKRKRRRKFRKVVRKKKTMEEEECFGLACFEQEYIKLHRRYSDSLLASILGYSLKRIRDFKRSVGIGPNNSNYADEYVLDEFFMTRIRPMIYSGQMK